MTAGLGAELERELRAAINPVYEDRRGTESYERKRLLGEIDRLRNVFRVNMLRLAPNTSHSEIDRILNGPNLSGEPLPTTDGETKR